MTYGTNRKTMDENICRSKLQHREFYSGYGNIDDSPATAIYLKRTDGSQCFYLPEYTVMGVHGIFTVGNVTDAYSTSTVEHIEIAFLAFRDTGGNVTIVIDPATPQTEAIATIVPTANTTVQGFEILVNYVGTPDVTTVYASGWLDFVITNELTYKNRMPAAGTAARTTAE